MATDFYFNLWAWPMLLLALPFASFTAVLFTVVVTCYVTVFRKLLLFLLRQAMVCNVHNN